jgi:hypothetical protein
LGTSFEDKAYGVATDKLGNVYLTGSTYGSMEGNNNSGSNDIFIIKFSGPPNLKLETGDIDQHAFYSSGNDTNTLTFNYTVQPNDNTSDLNYTSTGALSLNSGSIKDLVGNDADLTLPALDSSASLGGSKNIVLDGIRPTVVSTSPEDNSVSVTSGIYITFSEAMDTSSVTTNTGGTTCTGTLQVSADNFSSCVRMYQAPYASNSNKTFTLATYSDSGFLNNTTYHIRVTTGVKDSAGNAMSSQHTTTNGFTTIAADTTPPTVASVSPADGATGVSTSPDISITFSEAVSSYSTMTGGNSCTTGNFQLSTSSSFSSCLAWEDTPNISNDGKTLTLEPKSNLSSGKTYWIRVGNDVGNYDIKDSSGNAMSGSQTWSFTTE